jgi:hypothetical protein
MSIVVGKFNDVIWRYLKWAKLKKEPVRGMFSTCLWYIEFFQAVSKGMPLSADTPYLRPERQELPKEKAKEASLNKFLICQLSWGKNSN